MRRSFITAAAAVAVAGGAGVALAEDPPEPPTPVKAPVERPALAGQPAAILPAGEPFLPAPHPFGLHREIAEDMAEELGLPADRVAEAMKKAIGAQFDRRRNEALECFDDREKCKAVEALPPVIRGQARPVPVQPGRTTRP